MTTREHGARGAAELTGRSRAIQRVVEQIRHLAATRSTVLVEGGPGTGKTLAARSIHAHGSRAHEAFVTLDASALPAAMLERELFGSDEPEDEVAGRLERADRGTLYLAGIEALTPTAQIRLLRVLQDREFERVAGRVTRRVDVRLIAGARESLEHAVAQGRFREDLWVRLGVARLAMPALGERLDDIPPLVEVFVRAANREHRRKVTGATAGVLERLAGHTWPGNVRELEHTIADMVMAASGRRALGVADLPEALRAADPGDTAGLTVGMTVEEVERLLVRATLEHTGGDKPRAASLLGIGLRTLYRKIERYGLDAAGRPPRSGRAPRR